MGVVIRRAAVAAAAAVVLLGPAFALPRPAAAVPTTTTTFTYTGAEQTYAVPAGATAVTITAVGAPGGSGPSIGAGGKGAVVTATVPLPASTSTLYVEVGGAGTSVPSSPPAPGGFNGGGSSGFGGTGGGASDVRTVSCGSPCDTAGQASLASRLVVAGGGGGGALSIPCSGAAGGTAGDKSATGPGNGGSGAESCSQPDSYGGNGGFGGTAGGTGGAGTAEFPCNGGNGSLGQGGIAYFPPSCAGDYGGGGGGGYYGGGGGGDTGVAAGGSGGAGSSFWITRATETSMSEDTTGTPEVQITPVFDHDLAIAQPADITTDATGPSGANVSYSAPKVADGDDTSPPTASCSPKSGSVFPIGTTTVHCSATDTDDTPSTVSTSFTVTVRGAAAQLADLDQAVQNTRGGKGLAPTVALAERQAAGRHPLLACQTLNLFIIEVQLETPWRIPAGTAAQLIAAARQIQAVLGCAQHRSFPFGF